MNATEKQHTLPKWAGLMFKYVINPVSRPLLKSPLHGLADRFLLVLEFSGRKSNKTYQVPLAYDPEGNRGIRLFTDSAWVRNLHIGETVRVMLAGAWHVAEVAEISADPKTIARHIQDVVELRGKWYAKRFRLGRVHVENEKDIAERVHGMKTILLHLRGAA